MTNLHAKFIEETGQMPHYLKWVEEKLQKLLTEYPDPEESEETESVTSRLINSFHRMSDYDTLIDYDAEDLSYRTQVIFPRILTLSEKEEVENIINYWSNIPYVSTEGNYSIDWSTLGNNNYVLIGVDFTKSASDDYGAREILEKLAEWIWQGTPTRKDGSRKYDGVVKPLVVRADSV